MRTASSADRISYDARVRYALDLLRLRMKDKYDFGHLVGWERDISDLCRRYLSKPLDEMNVAEIGFGPRPTRLIWSSGMFGNVYGIDLEYPLTRLVPSQLYRIFRRNGALRSFKTALRAVMFDGAFYETLTTAFGKRFGRGLPEVTSIMSIGDASEASSWRSNPVDMIFSEDVFEHIAGESLPAVVERMHENLVPGGLALINVNVFSGITGGHLPEWYSRSLRTENKMRRTRPWEHLRENPAQADTYLNKVRIADYDAIFNAKFEIVEKHKINYGLGANFLTPEVAAKLDAYSRDELLTNQIRYVLRRR